MPFPERQPSLPAPFELCVLEQVDSVLDEGARRAAAGAPEGTLIWAGRQRDARTRRGHPWSAPAGNLHCALLIEPEYSNARASELCLVAALAAGAAIAEVVSPMTALGFEWPGDLLVNELLTGSVQLDAGPHGADPWAWVVIALSVNVAHHPPNPEPERYNSIHASGDAGEVDAVTLLELFARHFLRWINRWAEDGLSPIRSAWLQRAHTLATPGRLDGLGTVIDADTLSLGDGGELVIDGADGARRVVDVAHYFGLER